MKQYIHLDQILMKPDETEFTQDEMSAFLDRYLQIVDEFGLITGGSICRKTEDELEDLDETN